MEVVVRPLLYVMFMYVERLCLPCRLSFLYVWFGIVWHLSPIILAASVRDLSICQFNVCVISYLGLVVTPLLEFSLCVCVCVALKVTSIGRGFTKIHGSYWRCLLLFVMPWDILLWFARDILPRLWWPLGVIVYVDGQLVHLWYDIIWWLCYFILFLLTVFHLFCRQNILAM